jgi:hypothetical protein
VKPTKPKTKNAHIIRGFWNFLVIAPFIILAILFLYPRRNEFLGNSLVATPLRANRILALQLPATNAPPKVIILYNDDPYASPRLAIQGISGQFRDDDLKEVILDPELWSSLDDLRVTWCDSNPKFPTTNSQDVSYSLAFRCKDTFGIYAKKIEIPVGQLPQEFQQLIALFP